MDGPLFLCAHQIFLFFLSYFLCFDIAQINSVVYKLVFHSVQRDETTANSRSFETFVRVSFRLKAPTSIVFFFLPSASA